VHGTSRGWPVKHGAAAVVAEWYSNGCHVNLNARRERDGSQS
jgi:hypothetical protein